MCYTPDVSLAPVQFFLIVNIYTTCLVLLSCIHSFDAPLKHWCFSLLFMVESYFMNLDRFPTGAAGFIITVVSQQIKELGQSLHIHPHIVAGESTSPPAGRAERAPPASVCTHQGGWRMAGVGMGVRRGPGAHGRLPACGVGRHLATVTVREPLFWGVT